MLTCIACSKQMGGSLQHDPEDDDAAGTPGTRQAIRALTAQIKEMALKASGAYRHCKPCARSEGHQHRHAGYADSDVASGSERFHYPYRRAAACSGLGSSASTPRVTEARLHRVLSSGEVTPSSVSGRTEGGVVLAEEEHKEWEAQVEPGVLITFVSLPQGGNDLKKIRFSREMFNKWQAQRWWAENYDKVMELYNVRRFNRHNVPLPTPPRSEDESSKMKSAEQSPVTPPLSAERPPRNFIRPATAGSAAVVSSSSDSLDRHPLAARHRYDSGGLSSTPKLSSISGCKTETTSSKDASVRSSSSREVEEEEEEEEEDCQSGDPSASVSNASDQEREWVEQDEPGVYITIRALPGGIRELRRVRFSRERFSEMHARLWWEENRARIHAQYL